MKGIGLLAAFLLWQSALLVHIGTAAAPEHLRFQRAVSLPVEAAGLACARLDAEVLAHTASAAHNDLRVYRGYEGSPAQAETPYTLTESGPEPVGDAEATVAAVSRSGNTLHFDLHMPVRTYSEVDLQLRLHDFVGTAVVTAVDGEERRRELGPRSSGPHSLGTRSVVMHSLGTFGIFDLTGEHLGQWTVLALAETSDPVLHVALQLRTPAGVPIRNPPLAVVGGASVPPSRLRQTVYTPVASAMAVPAATPAVTQSGSNTVAVLHVPAHVPVERIRFSLPAAETANYWREVLVRARTDGDPAAETEAMDAGAIQHVRWPTGDPRLNPIDVTQNGVDATTGATLAGKATVRVLVANGTAPPLPIREVILEMRERKVCFLATPGARYTLRYGDPALAAPVYDEAALFAGGGTPVEAALGPERRNPQWRPRRDQRPYLDRHPEVFWVVVLLCGGLMGATGLHFVQQREHRV